MHICTNWSAFSAPISLSLSLSCARAPGAGLYLLLGGLHICILWKNKNHYITLVLYYCCCKVVIYLLTLWKGDAEQKERVEEGACCWVDVICTAQTVYYFLVLFFFLCNDPEMIWAYQIPMSSLNNTLTNKKELGKIYSCIAWSFAFKKKKCKDCLGCLMNLGFKQFHFQH